MTRLADSKILAGSMKSIEPVTMVGQVVDAIVKAATEGVILPGDRLKERDIGEALNVSRVPVREALRVLEGHHLAECRPHKGSWLVEFTEQQLRDVAIVRSNLEVLALETIHAAGVPRDRVRAALEEGLAEIAAAVETGTIADMARADVGYHRRLCLLSGNDALQQVWESLSMRIVVTTGLCMRRYDTSQLLDSHAALTDRITGAPERSLAALRDHIIDDFNRLHLSSIIQELRAARKG